MKTKHPRRALLLLLAVALCGCGSAGTDALTALLTIPPAVQEACAGVMEDSEIQAAIVAARVDRANGYTLAEELEFGSEGCTVQLLSGVSADACMACKTAILNSVYGL